MLNILHISNQDNKTGNGATARLLHRALLEAGVASEFWHLPADVANSETKEGSVLAKAQLTSWFGEKDLARYDVIHLHGMGQAGAALLLPFLGARPLVWSLQDCAPYTAGCSHSAHCEQWTVDCGNCPLAQGDAAKQREKAELLELKRDLYRMMSPYIVCANSWQKEQVGRSILCKQNAGILPLLSDRENFFLAGKTKARVQLGLPENSLVLILHTDLGEAREEVLAFVGSVLRNFRQEMCHITLVNIGKETVASDLADVVRNIDPQQTPFLVGEYYRAASLNLYFAGLDAQYAVLQEAGLCGLPSLAFDIGPAKELLDGQCGFVIQPFDRAALLNVLRQVMQQPSVLVAAGMKFYQKICPQEQALAAYLQLYGELSGKQDESKALLPAVQTDSPLERQRLLTCSYPVIHAFLENKRKTYGIEAEKDEQQKQLRSIAYYIYVDRFCQEWLQTVKKDPNREAVWHFVRVWTRCRHVNAQAGFFSQEEGHAFFDMCLNLRSVLVEYFQTTNFDEFRSLSMEANEEIIKLWLSVFLNLNGPLQLRVPSFACPPEFLQEKDKNGYPIVFLQSMFSPYITEDPRINVKAALQSSLPIALKFVLLLWATEVPLYTGTAFHQECISGYLKDLAEQLRLQPKAMNSSLRNHFFDHFVLGLWRISYLGGNTTELLRAYGDLLRAEVETVYPEFSQPLKPRKRKKGEKLRIGYISLNFRNQAVSQYMANRIKYHDQTKFFVTAFVLKKNSDEMTEKIKGWADEWAEFDNLQDFRAIAAAVKERQLDLLIYADIGMNLLTYMLGAMHLAPVQSVLVGHGTTTGLPTIDYYVSGDHEPADAQAHYTEKLIRLPRAGAAQLPPQKNESKLTRALIGVPEDAVLLISCANGMKHHHTRDNLLIDILRRVKQAYIVLKPFQAPLMVDHKFDRRIKEKAQAAGVADRLIVLPPLPNPGDLMGLLTLADIQLDTYPYGGWTTNLEALYYHLPIITQEGSMARNRWGAGLLRALDITEGIAQNEAEYVDWAVKIATDKELRERLTQKIAANVEEVLFNGKAAQPSYEAALVQMIETKEGRKIK